MLSSGTLGRTFGGRAFLKAELFQKTGSFKPRGVLTKLSALSQDEKERGVISVSAGNHAQALAWACTREGLDCLVVMWQGASEQKIAATREYGAAIDLEARDPAEAFERLQGLVAETRRVLVHPHEDQHVIAGQGTVGLEIVDDLPDTEVIVVPAGGGALVAGIATAARNRRVVAVEPEGSPGLHEALRAGMPVRVPTDSIADALLVPLVGKNPVEICTRLGVESVLVSEEEIRRGFRFLYERAKLAAEPGAAVGLAALLAGKIEDVEGKTIAVVVSGGNVSPEIASAILKEIPASTDET